MIQQGVETGSSKAGTLQQRRLPRSRRALQSVTDWLVECPATFIIRACSGRASQLHADSSCRRPHDHRDHCYLQPQRCCHMMHHDRPRVISGTAERALGCGHPAMIASDANRCNCILSGGCMGDNQGALLTSECRRTRCLQSGRCQHPRSGSSLHSVCDGPR